MSVPAAFMRDENFAPITTDGFIATKTIVYNGTTGRGAQGATTLFNVTGLVLARAIGVCAVDLASTSGTIEVGIAGNTPGMIAQTTATLIDAGESWVDNTPGTLEQLTATPRIVNGANIIETIATADITGGSLTYYLIWTPLNTNSYVTAA